MTTTLTDYEVGYLYDVPPGDLRIGANVRVDTYPDAKDFAASIKARGVIEVVSAYIDPLDGALTVTRGQRRTIVATQVGTPTVPVRVVSAPDETDRIIDQMTENLHRAGMHERETRNGVEQLALLGVSAAQITKRAALPRPMVDAALTVTANAATVARMDDRGMTLDEAAIYAEFEDDPEAVAALDAAWESPSQRPRLAHVAQSIRDTRAEAAALAAEVGRLRAEGLPVLDPEDRPARLYPFLMENLRNVEDGSPVPQEQWPTVDGAAVVVTVEWRDEQTDDDEMSAEPGMGYASTWICTDPEAAGLYYAYGPRPSAAHTPALDTDDPEAVERARRDAEAAEQARREAESAERRRVIANNAAWRSAETVRRDWLRGLLARRTVPKGAEVLIARGVLGRVHSLSAALTQGHALLGPLLSINAETNDGRAYRDVVAHVLNQATSPKAATMRTLAVVLAAWEQSSSVMTWRHPDAWDRAVMEALIAWGYPASDVELLLVARDETDDDAAPDESTSTTAA